MNNKESFYRYYNIVFASKDYLQEFNYIIQNWKMFGMEISNPRILDVGCGTGKHTIKFFNNGYEITGIDIDEKMIEIALSEYGRKHNVFQVADVTKKKFSKRFHIAYSYFFVINYIDDIEYLRRFFLCIYKIIEEGGIYAFDLVNGNATSFSPPVEKKIEISNGNVKVHGKLIPSYDTKFNTASYHYVLEVTEMGRTIKIDYFINQVYWNPFVIVQLLKNVGYKNVHIFKHLSFNEDFSNHDYKLSFVCTK
jgi:SAM-dependent methyltransferase